jgi:endoglucanase
MNLTSLLKTLSEAHGISGHEDAIRAVVLREWGRFADETRTDKLGNAIAVRYGSSSTDRLGRRPATAQAKSVQRTIMLASHMDEIGLMVASLQHGFIQVVAIGDVDPRVLPGQEVIVHGRAGELPGIIASTPPHLLKPGERGKVMPLDRLWIDVGLPARQVGRLVQPGDLISLRRSMLELKNGLLAGKAFDNRASVAAVAVCLELLQSKQHQWNVRAVATVQEEVNYLGAHTAAFGIAPDVALAIDVTFGTQHGSPEAVTFALGQGPTIGIGPNMHPRLTQGLLDAAKRLEFEAPLEPMTGDTRTDGWAIQVARAGIPTGLLGIPLRSMHTPIETVSPQDIERTGRLMAEFIGGLDEEFYRALTDR